MLKTRFGVVSLDGRFDHMGPPAFGFHEYFLEVR